MLYILAIADQKAKPNWLKAHWYPQGNIFSEFRIFFQKYIPRPKKGPVRALTLV